MKHYIQRTGQPDFVCIARTAADALILLWLATGEIPQASYRVHQGRKRKSRVVSSALAYWRLSIELQTALADVLEATLPEKQYTEFCEQVVNIGRILEK